MHSCIFEQSMIIVSGFKPYLWNEMQNQTGYQSKHNGSSIKFDLKLNELCDGPSAWCFCLSNQRHTCARCAPYILYKAEQQPVCGQISCGFLVPFSWFYSTTPMHHFSTHPLPKLYWLYRFLISICLTCFDYFVAHKLLNSLVYLCVSCFSPSLRARLLQLEWCLSLGVTATRTMAQYLPVFSCLLQLINGAFCGHGQTHWGVPCI